MNNKLIAALAAVGGVGVGAAVAHILTKKAMYKRLDTEIQEFKKNYRPIVRTESGRLLLPSVQEGTFSDKTAEEHYRAAKDIVTSWELINGLGYGETRDDDYPAPSESIEEFVHPTGTPSNENATTITVDDTPRALQADEEEVEEVPAGNIFDNRLKLGSYILIPGQPHLITRQEFEEQEPDYETGSLTWYEGDKVLADDLTSNGSAEIENVDYVIGSRHLEMFGLWSDDPEVFYVRNELISTKYEVSRNAGTYENIVLGLEPGSV